jgi:putative transposase
VTKYRYKVLRGNIAKRVRELVRETREAFEIRIVRRIKGRTSSKLFEEFPHVKKSYWGAAFGARVCFCATVGQMTEEMTKQYLEHHFEPRPNDNSKMEAE